MTADEIKAYHTVWPAQAEPSRAHWPDVDIAETPRMVTSAGYWPRDPGIDAGAFRANERLVAWLIAGFFAGMGVCLVLCYLAVQAGHWLARGLR